MGTKLLSFGHERDVDQLRRVQKLGNAVHELATVAHPFQLHLTGFDCRRISSMWHRARIRDVEVEQRPMVKGATLFEVKVREVIVDVEVKQSLTRFYVK